MCNYTRCSFCRRVHLGLLMAWQVTATLEKETGHVCYGCEDLICNQIVMGRAPVRWLDSLEGCD